MTKPISHKNLDTPIYKVTGVVFDGRTDLDTNLQWVMRITPRYFQDIDKANKFFNDIEQGVLWKLVSLMSEDEYKYKIQKYKPKGAYGIIRMKNMSWPMGVRAGNNKYTPRKKLARADPNNVRHGDKYPSSKYNSWRSEGRKKESKK